MSGSVRIYTVTGVRGASYWGGGFRWGWRGEEDLRSEDPELPRRNWLRTSSVSLVLAMLFLICIMDI